MTEQQNRSVFQSETKSPYLRKVDEKRAFQFYKDKDLPLNLRARSLEEFRECLLIADLASVEYHTRRNDFAKWIGMIGDRTLAQRLSSVEIGCFRCEELKHKIIDIVEHRISELRKRI